ncbi:MAG: hypothetical protein LBG74_00835 [Spirochaetaceae bacterium]|jgi:hypothetical protein|nr:hypothetical protein [Spirochaetaceae bacterium]
MKFNVDGSTVCLRFWNSLKCVFFLTALLGASIPVFAQNKTPAPAPAETPDEDDGEDDNYVRRGGIDWSNRFSTYTKGDKTFGISVGTLIPLFFVQNNGRVAAGYGEGSDNVHIKIGGTGSLAYTHFLTPHIFLGGELQGAFAGTLSEKLLYIIPIGIKGGYQWTLSRFEFPLSLTLGMATQVYTASSEPVYWGLFLRPQGAVFFRINHDWSFGLSAGWWWVPEWAETRSKSVDGHFLDIMLTARYHF